MRLAEIVRVRKGQLEIPDAFARPLGLYDASQLYLCKVIGHKQHQILTTIPWQFWEEILRVSVLLQHHAGALDVVAEAISSLDASILVMEGYGREPDKEGWWSGVVKLPAPSTGSSEEALAKAKQAILEMLFGIYEAPSDDQIFPFPERLRPSGGDAQVERFEDGLRTIDGKEKVVLVEQMRLCELKNKTKEPDPDRDIVSFRAKSSSVTVGRDWGSNSRAAWGLLMCNTEERFIRFIQIECPVEIELEIVSRPENPTRLGVGVLPALTGVLRSFDTEEEEPGINIVYLFNYITEQNWEPPAGSRGRGEGRMVMREQSVTQFFLEPPPGWLTDVRGNSIEKRWCEVFYALAHAKVGERFVVNWPRSTMRLWSGSKLTFVLNKRGEVRPESWVAMLRRKPGLSVWAIFCAAGVALGLSILLSFLYSLEWTGVGVGVAGLCVAVGGILLGRQQRGRP